MSYRPIIKKLANEVTLVLVPMAENPTVTVTAFARTGAVDEQAAQAGLSHFLEHMMFKGTRDMDNKELMRYLDGLGAETNAFTWYDFTGYYVKGAARHVSKLITTLARVYQDAIFPDQHIEIEKGVVLGEIDMYEDLPQHKVVDSWHNLLYGDSTAMGRPVIGSKETVRSFTRDDLAQYHHDRYVGGNTVVVVAGGFAPKEVTEVLKQHWSILPKGRSGSSRKKVMVTKEKIQCIERTSEQAHLVLGVSTVPYGHKDEKSLELAASILGSGMSSRLFERLREDMGAGYYVRCEHETAWSGGYFVVRTGTDADRVPEVVNAIRQEIERLQKDPVPEAELKKTKEFLLGNLRMSLETSDAVAQFFGVQAMYPKVPMDSPTRVMQKVKAVSAVDIQRVSRKYLQPTALRLVVLGRDLDQGKIYHALTNGE